MSGARYHEVAPPPALRSFVECLWIHSAPVVAGGANPDGQGRRILPDGRMDLVWIDGLGALVAGPQSSFTTRPAVTPLLAYGMRFHPGAAPVLLGCPADAFRDAHVPLEAVDGRLASRLDDRLGEAAGPRQALGGLAAEIARTISDLEPPDPAVRAAAVRLGGAHTTVAGVASSVALSERELQRRFARDIGYGPKTLQRVLRFQRAVARLGTPGAVGLADAAASAGYADQAHLSRESKRLSGLSPSGLVAWLG